MTRVDGGISRFTAIFASGTLFSRVLGMARDILTVNLIPTASLDAFIVAFKLPNMLRDIVGEGAMNAAFVPVFTEYREKEPEADFRNLLASAMGVMALVLTVLSLAGVFLVPALIQAVDALRVFTGAAPRAHEELQLAARLARWTFPYLFFIGMTVFAMGPLFTLRQYAAPSWSPCLLNVAIILCCLLFRDGLPWIGGDPAWALVAGVWLGGLTQLALLQYALWKQSGVWRPTFRLTHPGVKRIMLLMGPVIVGQAAGEVNKLADTLFAYSLPEEGIVTALYCANRLVQLPLSMFGFATAAAILPIVSACYSRQDMDGLRRTVMQGVSQTVFLVAPAAFGLIVLGAPIVRLLFERGSFTAEDTTRTATALGIYALGLLAFSLVKVAVTGFYGMQDTKTPVIVSSCAMLLNVALNMLLIRPMGYQGLAWATTISYTVNFIALYALLAHRTGELWDASFITGLIRTSVAAIVSAAAAYGTRIRVSALFNEDVLLSRLACVGLPIMVAMICYFVLAWSIGAPEARRTLSWFTRRLVKQR